MRKNLQTQFSSRQYMMSKDFEIYYYNDTSYRKVGSHAHDYYEIYFFLEGNVRIQIGQENYQVRHGDIMIIPPRVNHKPTIRNMDTPYRRFVFWISQEYCRYLQEISPDYMYLFQYVQTHKEYLFHNDQITFNGIQSKIIRLIGEVQADRFCKNAQITLCVNDLLLHLNRVIYEHNHPASRQEENSLYDNLCSYIEDHMEEDLSLEHLAREFYVSKYHIAHVFKDNLGISIHQYITKKRLSQCRTAIVSGITITEAYQTFGFGDYSSFYRAFKKEYGISPKDYRDMQQEIQHKK